MKPSISKIATCRYLNVNCFEVLELHFDFVMSMSLLYLSVIQNSSRKTKISIPARFRPCISWEPQKTFVLNNILHLHNESQTDVNQNFSFSSCLEFTPSMVQIQKLRTSYQFFIMGALCRLWPRLTIEA